ncbi:MAG: DUF4129 domain-containing protein [Acidobacteriota bacterium]
MRIRILLLLVLLTSISVFADTPVDDYANRLERASSTIAALLDEDEDDPSDAQVVSALDSVGRLIRATEQVRFGDETVRIDNAWMIDSINHLSRRYSEHHGSDESRYGELVELAGRIVLLAERVTGVTPATVAAEQRAKLDGILAREEYQPEIHQESRIQKWISQALAAFLKLLRLLLPEPSNAQSTMGRTSLDFVRILIALGLLVAFVIGLRRLVRRLQVRRYTHKDEEDGVGAREVLGEAISEDATAQDLLAKAAALAKFGDYRSAIRLTFIALLLELESRGKLRLDRAKTNYDYVNEIRPDAALFGPVASMTSAFEKVWYGQQRASSEAYAEFVAEFGRLDSGSTS